MSKKVVILGAGPTGLSAAYSLKRDGISDFHLFEQNSYAGGLSSSFQDEKQFVWDKGGHVIYSKDKRVNAFLDEFMGKEWVYHLKESYVRLLGKWIPYPFQLNLHALPKEICWECLQGLIENKNIKSPENFYEWILKNFGHGIASRFLFPYNEKLWKISLKEMGYYWTDDRVCIPELSKILKNMIFENNDFNWGNDYRFRYPLKGGVGEIFRRVSDYIGENISLRKKAVKIDPVSRKIFFEDNSNVQYDYLISTIPVTELITLFTDIKEDLLNASSNLKYNSLMVVGLGFNKPYLPKGSWMYFPENEFNFFRVSNYSNYSHYNVPNNKLQFSLICEIAYNPGEKKRKAGSVIRETIQSLKLCDIIEYKDEELLVSEFFSDIDYAYPLPLKDRDSHLKFIIPKLEQLNIFSRGRFGGFKYEKSNIESCILQGFETAQKISRKTPEKHLFE